jgi:uncharacterized damage-inducible protein DinB
MPDHLAKYRQLFDYDYWANAETLASLESAPSAREKTRRIFNHVIGAQRTWLARFGNPAPPAAQPWPDLPAETWAPAIEELRQQWKGMLDQLTPERLAGDLVYKTTQGVECRTPIADVLMHLVLHSAYHRGQVAAAIREAGGKPAVTDYVVFLRLGKGR